MKLNYFSTSTHNKMSNDKRTLSPIPNSEDNADPLTV